MKDFKDFTCYMKLSENIVNMACQTESTEIDESFGERCLAISAQDISEKNMDLQSQQRTQMHRTDSVTSMEVNASQRALALTLAASRQSQNQPLVESITEVKKHYQRSDRIPQEMEYIDESRRNTTQNETTACPISGNWRCIHADSGFYAEDASCSDKAEELRLAQEKIRQLQKAMEKLRRQNAVLLDANQKWACHMKTIEKEHKRTTRSSSAGDVRTASSNGVLSEVCSNGRRNESVCRKSASDLDEICKVRSSRSGENQTIESLKTRVSLLTEQVKIYKDDFALERRDRVRSVREAHKLRQEVERLKMIASKQRQQKQPAREQYHQLTCDDFDYLNQ